MLALTDEIKTVVDSQQLGLDIYSLLFFLLFIFISFYFNSFDPFVSFFPFFSLLGTHMCLAV